MGSSDPSIYNNDGSTRSPPSRALNPSVPSWVLAGQAQSLGVSEGCVVVGLNGEEYLSHAHTVATLKHARRPILVRFRAPAGRAGR